MNDDLVSVVIPTFNRAYCLPGAIDSVLAQTHGDIELIIVDDGSTDGTEGLLQKKYAGDRRIRYLRQENQGVSAARNLGLARAKGHYIALLDSDDVWMPWKLELQIAGLRHFPDAGMIWTDMQAIDATGAVLAPRYLRKMYSAWDRFELDELFTTSCSVASVLPSLPHPIADKKLYFGDLGSPMITGNMVHTSTVLLKRKRLEEVGEFNRKLLYSGEDYDFHLRTCRQGPVAFADVASIQYRVGAADQLTRPELSVHLAQNFLDTILPIITHERGSIDLPDGVIDEVLADAYAWLGEKQLDCGDTRSAGRHLFRSLRHRYWQPRIAALAMISLLPPRVSESCRSLYRHLKGGTQKGASTIDA